MSLDDTLTGLKEKLENILDEIGEHFQLIPAEITRVDLEEQGTIILISREIQELLREGSKCVNKTLSSAEQHICQTIANEIEDGVTYRHPKGTITATARGFFGINNPVQFFAWVKQEYGANNAIAEFVGLVSSKTKRKELCEGLLIDGKQLPQGIKEHIIASVHVRRKKHG